MSVSVADATIAQYLTAPASSSVQKKGPGVTANIKKIVVVRINPGSGPSPSKLAAGDVVALLCTPANSWRVSSPAFSTHRSPILRIS